MPTVCIGGVNASNIPQVMFRGSPPENPLDGVAVVSAIVAARDPEAASRELLGLVRGSVALRQRTRSDVPKAAASKESILELVPGAIKAVHEQKPLSHNMTNLVRRHPALPSMTAWLRADKIYRLSKTSQQMSPSLSEHRR